VATTFIAEFGFIFEHALTTIAEILSGLAIGCALGIGSALAITRYAPLKRWMLPVMVMSQAVPVFALAPLLVLWFGYGMASKIVMAVLIIYFPVTAAFYDGLRRAEPGWLDLARTMGASPGAELRHVRIPAALPALASGIRVATAVAPIGAIVGEWVGSSAGLGYLMLHANARMQVDLMFAALLFLALFAVLLYSVVDTGLRRLTRWQADTGVSA
jgi:putative hydroxymethylpyrimidine transport system permease protein